MAMGVGNYAKAKQKIIFIDENVMRVNGKNLRWLNDQWILRWHDYLHENGNIMVQVTLKIASDVLYHSV